MRILFIIAAALLTITAHPNTSAQPGALGGASYAVLVGTHPSASAMARAIDARLAIGVSPEGERLHVWHCRQSSPGCRKRIAAMSKVITEVSNEHGIDPFLTAAIAIRETGLNPLALGPVGERGIVQLHPEYVGRTVPYVNDESYRDSCQVRPAACQREVLEAGLGLFVWAVKKCDNVADGLGWYNSGHCQQSIYSRSVLRERRKLLRLAKRVTVPEESLFAD